MRRVNQYRQENGLGRDPRVIFPILLCPPNYRFKGIFETLPDYIRKIQYTHLDYPERYNSHGLARMFGLTRYRDDYIDFVSTFADKLIEVLQEFSLPSQDELINIEDIANAFSDVRDTEDSRIDSLQSHDQTPMKAEGIGPKQLVALAPRFGT